MFALHQPATGTPVVTPHIIELNDVSKEFGGVTVLDAVSMQVPAGAYLALGGVSGAGKTTRAERKTRSLTLLNELGLEHRSHHRAIQLAGGEQQRVAIARALINDPEVILADEPTGNLPHELWSHVLDLLEAEWKNGKTVIVITHEPGVAARAQRVVRLRDGRLEG